MGRLLLIIMLLVQTASMYEVRAGKPYVVCRDVYYSTSSDYPEECIMLDHWKSTYVDKIASPNVTIFGRWEQKGKRIILTPMNVVCYEQDSMIVERIEPEDNRPEYRRRVLVKDGEYLMVKYKPIGPDGKKGKMVKREYKLVNDDVIRKDLRKKYKR